MFAREVAETKAMDDAINRLEGMFAGTDKEEPMAPRKGDNTARTSSFGPSSEVSPWDYVVTCLDMPKRDLPLLPSNRLYAD